MVGVPGRSKACHNCRQRKIRCDGELPTCRNCAKSKRDCTGYHRQHAFILSRNMVPETNSRSPALTGCEGASGLVMLSRWRAGRNQPSTASTLLATAFALPQQIPTRNVFRDKFLSLIADMDFPISSGLYRIFGARYNWHMHILHLSSLSPALENSLLALCTARLGRHMDRPELVQQSLELYTKGVALVRRNIFYRSTRDIDEQSPAACLSLLLYEAIECPGSTIDGYQAHYRGCLGLLQMRGAVAHISGLAHATLQVLRLHTVHVVMRNQQHASFLAQPEWLNTPWSSNSKSPFDRLIDILLSIPNYSTQAHTHATGPWSALQDTSTVTEEIERTRTVIKEVQRLQESLQQWFEDFQRSVPGNLYYAELSTIETGVDDAEMGKLFPVAFRFPSFMVGQALLYYWVAVTIIQIRLCQTHAALACLIESLRRDRVPCSCDAPAEVPARCLQHVTVALLPELDGDGWAAVYNICQSAEYFLQDTARGFGPASVLPALALVKGLWKQGLGSRCRDRQIAWVDDIVGRIHLSGYSIAATVGAGV